jgi:hypothetical protein
MSDPTPSEPAEPTAAGPPAPEGSAPAPARRSTYLRSGAVALGVVVIIGVLINFLLLQHHTGSTVDGGEISQRISQGIQFNTKASEPPQVACPRSVPASETSFDCTLEKGSGRVVIEVQRLSGRFTWTITNRPAGTSPS